MGMTRPTKSSLVGMARSKAADSHFEFLRELKVNLKKEAA